MKAETNIICFIILCPSNAGIRHAVFRVGWMSLLAQAYSEQDGRFCVQTQSELRVDRRRLLKDHLEISECVPFDAYALLPQFDLSLLNLQ